MGELENENKIDFIKKYLDDLNFSQNLINKQPIIDKIIKKKIEKEREIFISGFKKNAGINNVFNYITLYNFRKFIRSHFIVKIKKGDIVFRSKRI